MPYHFGSPRPVVELVGGERESERCGDGGERVNTARATLQFRLKPLHELVSVFGFELGEVSLRQPTNKSICLPDKKTARISVFPGQGNSGSFIFSAKLFNEYPSIIKATQVSHRLFKEDTPFSGGKEAWIHSKLCREILFPQKAPGLLGHGVSYLCSSKKLRLFKPKKNRKWTLLTYMEQGDFTFFRWLVNHARRVPGGMTDDEIRPVLFKILFTLASVVCHFPRFRHNDLHSGNVIMVSMPAAVPEVYAFSSGHKDGKRDRVFYLPPSSHTPAIYDFGFSYLGPGGKYGKDFESKVGVSSKVDRYYDLHTFFNNILNVAEEFSLDLPSETMDFIEDVVPSLLRIAHRRTTVSDEQTLGRYWYGQESPKTPRARAWKKKMLHPNPALAALVEHPYFSVFRRKPDNLVRVGNSWVSPL